MIVRAHAGFGKERQEKKMLPTDNEGHIVKGALSVGSQWAREDE